MLEVTVADLQRSYRDYASRFADLNPEPVKKRKIREAIPNSFRHREDGVTEIALKDGRVCLVDTIDYEVLGQARWHLTAEGYVRGKFNGKLAYIHRIVMVNAGWVVNLATRGDHINRDGLDNRRCNLRPATNSENMRNRICTPSKKLGRYKGVFWVSEGSGWRVRITSGGVSYGLGCFTTEEAAARAYDAKARELHGEFARLNFPEAS